MITRQNKNDFIKFSMSNSLSNITDESGKTYYKIDIPEIICSNISHAYQFQKNLNDFIAKYSNELIKSNNE